MISCDYSRYQFFIWNVMGYWCAVVMALYFVVSRKSAIRAASGQPEPAKKVRCREFKVSKH